MATERTVLVLAQLGGGPDGLDIVPTRKSYRTFTDRDTTPREIAFFNKLNKIRKLTMDNLRLKVPRHPALIPILDVIYDEDPGRYYFTTAYDKLIAALDGMHRPVTEPKEITFETLSSRLCSCVPIVEFVAEVIKQLKFQHRPWFLNTRRYEYSVPAVTPGDRISDRLTIDPPIGHMRHYMLWVNDLALSVGNPALWKQRETFFRGPVPDYVRQVTNTPRSDDTESMETIEPSTEEDETEAEDEEEAIEEEGDRVLDETADTENGIDILV